VVTSTLAPATAPNAIPTPAPLVSAQAKTPASASKAVPAAAKAPVAVASAPAAAKGDVPAKSDTAAKTNGGHWGVKLGTFAEAANLKRQQAKATEAKFKTYTETLDTADGPRTRLWAGPFDTKAQAERARDKLKKAGINGLVAELQAG
jgi:DedD protein